MKKIDLELYKYYKNLTDRELVSIANRHNDTVDRMVNVFNKLYNNKKQHNRFKRINSLMKFENKLSEDKEYIENELTKRAEVRV